MGMYDNQYESYYAKIMQKGKGGMDRQGSQVYNRGYDRSNNMFSKQKLVNEFILQLVVTLILLGAIVFCKFYNTNKTQYIYRYGKNIMKQNYEIKFIINDVKNLKINDLNSKIDDYLDMAKSNIFNVKPLKQRAKENFKWPTASREFISYDKSEDKSIMVKEKANEKVFSIGEGIVKENNINKTTKESYVVLDHGGGIESVYIGIVTNKLEKGMKVKQGQEIGKTLGNFKFQLLYMGKEKNPVDYISIT